MHALIAGAPGIAVHAAKLAAHGADVVLVIEHDGFTHYNPEALAATLAARIATGYRAAFFAASAQGTTSSRARRPRSAFRMPPT